MNKDLLFKLTVKEVNEEIYIKGKYINYDKKVIYTKLDENGAVENINDIFENYMCMYEEDKQLYDILIQKIKSDNILDKIQAKESNRLLFAYEI